MAPKSKRTSKKKAARWAGEAAFLRGALTGVGIFAAALVVGIAFYAREHRAPKPPQSSAHLSSAAPSAKPQPSAQQPAQHLVYEEPLTEGAVIEPVSPESIPLREPPRTGNEAPIPRSPEDMAAISPAAPPVPPPAAGEEAAWQKYAVAAPAETDRPMIAIVIDDVGVDRARSARAETLPGPLTLSFLPYAHDLAHQTEVARESGHELMVHVPMEPESATVDPGPDALLTSNSPQENLRRLRLDLSRFAGYVGINNHMGSKFTADRAAMNPVVEELKARGLLFLDSMTTSHSVGWELARADGVPYADRQVFLDNDQSASEVKARLAETERIAREHGYAIAIGHPHDGTLEALTEWIPAVKARGFVLVPVSAIVRHRMIAGGLLAAGHNGAPDAHAPN